jgi:hypothetical protein
MTIAPISNQYPVNGAQGVQSQTLASKSAASSQPPADTIQLSPAAKAQLQGGDVDHDGDRH